jgi:sec-independent protein translocase protein TatA
MPNLSPTEIVLILLVVILLFGAKRLPDTARGLGRALRIFKSETKGLRDDDDANSATRVEDTARQPAPPPPAPLPPREISAPPRDATGANGVNNDVQPVKDAERSER